MSALAFYLLTIAVIVIAVAVLYVERDRRKMRADLDALNLAYCHELDDLRRELGLLKDRL